MNFQWIINGSKKKSNLLDNHKIFEENIFILDHLSGKEPFLFNQNLIKKGKNDLYLIPLALLDSNMASAIYEFVEKNKISKGLIEFIEFATKNKWGYSLHFYYMEAYTKNVLTNEYKNKIREYLIKHTEAILKIYLMDEDFFLRERVYIETSRQDQKDFYLNGKTINEVSVDRVDNFITNYTSHINILAIEVLLLKMIFIKLFEETKNKPLDKKLNEFNEFMQKTLGKIFSREVYLAKKYFTDKAGTIFGIQKNTKYEKVLSTIKSTAWDLFLLRYPEYSFVGDGGNEFDIGFIVTQEKSLFDLGKLFKYDSIYIQNDIPIPTFVDTENLGIIKINDEQKEDLQLLYDSMLQYLRICFPN
ncbi:hypothetical protein BKG95_04915 [Rodentibacter pneumotropicus]|uniref:Uncharacterized protein n=1 Tax=Rodentibacter pneumotropicus TaxID=758 RepID=A0AAW5LCT4_9PAST|nr:hypothetical protein [Rodentibacter pneumotropicus]MCQ9121873.1 hypothetical protein [Rodentibacter pneumotropicus]OOF68054.1 hypothetical protein BKG95_04915 [Rodentibacter pneumotropicus]